MTLHFDRAEFEERQRRARAALAEAGLDGLLIFRQESMYYLTGYDTFGYCFFQCLYLGADGVLALLTRAPDLRQAEQTSIIDDIRIWRDDDNADPAGDLRRMLADLGCQGKRLGVEYEAAGLTAANGKRLEAALSDWCKLRDASDLVNELRVVKGAAELSYVRRAAELADQALDLAVRMARPGAFEGDILAAMQGAVFRGGGDYPGNAFIIGSGPGALLCRYHAGRRQLSAQDQLTLEFAGSYRHYHACLMRTLLIGEADPAHVEMHAICHEALEACIDQLRPGRTAGEVFTAHADVLGRSGFGDHRLNACGYSLGATYPPVWMDRPMFFADSPFVLAAGMVFFLHIILMDSPNERAMTLGTTVEITDGGPSLLSRAPLDLVVNG